MNRFWPVYAVEGSVPRGQDATAASGLTFAGLIGTAREGAMQVDAEAFAREGEMSVKLLKE